MPFGSRRRTSAEEGVSYSALGSRIEQLLRLAQEQAEQIVAEAHAEAERIIAAARAEAGQIRAGAGEEAGQIRADAGETGPSGVDGPPEPF
jgi:cell division septum initiation protein DivIVA